MTLRLATTAFACGLATMLFTAPAEAGGHVYVRSGSSCGTQFYRHGSPRRTVVVNSGCHSRPRVVYSHGRCAPKAYRGGYTYRGDGQYYPRAHVRTSHVVVERPKVVYRSQRGYSRCGDRVYISRRR